MLPEVEKNVPEVTLIEELDRGDTHTSKTDKHKKTKKHTDKERKSKKTKSSKKGIIY